MHSGTPSSVSRWRKFARTAIIVAGVWFALPIAAGFVPGLVKPEHGSILWVVYGLYLGILGTITHGALLALRGPVPTSFRYRWLLV